MKKSEISSKSSHFAGNEFISGKSRFDGNAVHKFNPITFTRFAGNEFISGKSRFDGNAVHKFNPITFINSIPSLFHHFRRFTSNNWIFPLSGGY